MASGVSPLWMVAGVISPMLSGNATWLAVGAAASTALGWAFWHWEIGTGENLPEAPRAPAALEPTERM